MPTPQENETEENFIQRCIPIVLNDGTAETPEQAYAVCESMYEADKFDRLLQQLKESFKKER
jgi:hypothetical protein